MKGTPSRQDSRALGVMLTCAVLQFGCLDDPPIYTAAVRIPPIVDFSQVTPPFSVVHQIRVGQDSMHIDVPFRSEDLNDEVLGVLLLDAAPGEVPHVISDQRLRPSVFEDPMRSFSTDVTDFGAPGCHTLTLLLTHVSNTSAFRFEVIDESLATRVMWVLAVHADPDEVLLGDCPTRGFQRD